MRTPLIIEHPPHFIAHFFHFLTGLPGPDFIASHK